MITIDDLINFSSKSRYELTILCPRDIPRSVESIDRFILINLALQIVTNTEFRPLPNPAWLIGSQDARKVFGDLIRDTYNDIESQKASAKNNKTQLDLFIQLTKEEIVYKKEDGINSFIPKLENPMYGDISKIKRMLNNYIKSKQLMPFFDLYRELCKKYILSPFDIYKLVTSQIPTSYSDPLAKVSLQVYSAEFVREETPEAHIIHFYEGIKDKRRGNIYTGSPRGSEYLSGYDSSDEVSTSSFVQTNHGIGSGVYGMQHLTKETINDQITSRQANFCIVSIESPLRLDDGAHYGAHLESDTLTRCSRYLMQVGDLVKKEQIASQTTGTKLTREDALNHILAGGTVKATLLEEAQHLSRFKNLAGRFNQQIIYTLLIGALHRFLQDSKQPDYDIVAMPINYLINQLGFTGVISKTNDALNRGLIAMNVPDNWYRVPVKHYAKLFPSFFSDGAVSPRIPSGTNAFKDLSIKKMIFNGSVSPGVRAAVTENSLASGSATTDFSAFTRCVGPKDR